MFSWAREQVGAFQGHFPEGMAAVCQAGGLARAERVTPGWLVDDSIYDRDENVVRSPFGGMSGA